MGLSKNYNCFDDAHRVTPRLSADSMAEGFLNGKAVSSGNASEVLENLANADVSFLIGYRLACLGPATFYDHLLHNQQETIL